MKNKIVAILLQFTFLLFSLGQLARISFPDQPVFFYLYEVFLAFVTVILVIRFQKKPLETSTWVPVLLFFGYLFLSFFLSLWEYSFEQNIVAFLYFLRLMSYVIFFMYVRFFFRQYSSGWTQTILTMTTGWIILSSFIQYFLYANLGNLAYLGWDPHLYRVVGLFFDPPITISVFVLLILYFVSGYVSTKRRLIFLLIIPLVILSFLTYSRGGYLGMGAVFLMFVLRNRNWKVLILLVAILAGGLLLVPKGTSEGINLLRTTSISARFKDYEKAIQIWKTHPIVGIGYNHIRYEKDVWEEEPIYGPYNPSHGSASFHSSFLVILVTGGIIGLLLYLGMIVYFARISDFMLYSTVYLSIISLFDNVLLHPMILFLLFFLEAYRSGKHVA